jgi:hypothetical protein
MRGQGGIGDGFQLALVELVFENVVDPFVRADAGGIGALTGGFQARRGPMPILQLMPDRR